MSPRASRVGLEPRRSGSDRFTALGRTPPRALATRVWPLTPSVYGRIAIARPCHLHDPPAKNHSAWESISARGQPAFAALALTSPPNRSESLRRGTNVARRATRLWDSRDLHALDRTHPARVVSPTAAC